MSALRCFAPTLALLLYFAIPSNCVPVDVALNKSVEARVTCGYRGPERFLSHRFVYSSRSVREENIETCIDQTAYPPTAMVDGQRDTWWQSASRTTTISVLGASTKFDAEISIDLQQVCIGYGIYQLYIKSMDIDIFQSKCNVMRYQGLYTVIKCASYVCALI